MGILRDLLKKAGIPDFQIVKYEKNVEREIIIKQKVVMKNVQVSANLPAYAADDRIISKADEFLKPGIGYVRDDLVYAESAMLAAKKEQHDILREFRDCIEPRYFQAMIVAYAIINCEDIGDWELAYSILDSLVKAQGERGRHVYNLCRSGYMEGYFLHELRKMKFESGNGGAYKARFKVFFSTCVASFDFAIWSNDLMNAGDIQYQLRVRMKDRGITAVKVYGRGDANIEKVRVGCASYLKEDKEAQLENDQPYRICNSPCCCLSITKKVREPPPGIFKKQGRKKRRR